MRLPTGPEVLETEIGSQLNDSGRRLVQPDGEQLTGERVGGSFQAGQRAKRSWWLPARWYPRAARPN